jgi:MYXO-CTERM domain-containing protein
MKGRWFAATAAACLFAAGSAYGGAAVEFAAPGSVANGDNGPWTLGYEFRVNNASVLATALGYYDHLGDGLGQSHEVGLWDINGNLLASTTVVSTDTLIGHFRWAAITPVVLNAGTSYRVGGVSGGQGGGDFYTWNTSGHASDPAITFVGDRWIGGGTLQFPTNTSNVANGFYGGNVFLDEVPAPGAIALLGLAGLVSRRRRR